MPADAIQAEGLTRRFHQEGRVLAVDHVSFSVEAGCLFGLFGGNGAGKTTTMHMLCGRLRPSAGRALVLGRSVTTELLEVQDRMGIMSQRESLHPGLGLLPNLRLAAQAHHLPREEEQRRFGELCERLGHAPDEADQDDLRRPARLWPRGAQRRTAFLLALLHRPEVLFLDEPSTGMDVYDQRRLWEVLREEAQKGTTIFVTTHHPEEAERCDRLGILVEGRLHALGTPRELSGRY